MVAKLFIDTWGWLTLHDKGERYHQQATQAYQQELEISINISPQVFATGFCLNSNKDFSVF